MDTALLSKYLIRAIDLLDQRISWRINQFLGNNTEAPVWEWQIPEAKKGQAFHFINEMNEAESVIFYLALCPHFHPVFFDEIISKNLPTSGAFPSIGGVRGKQFTGFIPTGETALFVLAGTDLTKRMEIQKYFSHESFFYKRRILWLEDPLPGEPRMSGKIIVAPEFIELFTEGRVSKPRFSTEFPAKIIETNLEWEDLVLADDVKQQIYALQHWIKHNETLLNDWGMAKRIKPGYKVLFHGPPGTGKTMTAGLLGKYTGRDVYRIDLSTVVSKYIGETEKNLSSLFDIAEDKNWILFFDEADSIFGKRTNVRDAHDKYANQEVSYLLQRIEEFNGLVILASNFKSNIDEAFMRRFHRVVRFNLPDKREREEIWSKIFPEQLLDRVSGSHKNLIKMASKYDLTGGHIINVMQYACLKCLANGDQVMPYPYVLEGIKLEFEKEGRVFSE